MEANEAFARESRRPEAFLVADPLLEAPNGKTVREDPKWPSRSVG